MEELLKYLRKTLGQDIQTDIVPMEELDKLPSYLRGNFKLSKLSYMGIKCLLAETTSGVTIPTPQLTRQLQKLKEVFGLVTVLVVEHIMPTLRNSLTNRKVNFIVTGKQLFLPELMINLEEKYKIQPVKRKLLPSAQVILLYWILRRNERMERSTFKQLAGELKYTTMAIGTAVSNLFNLGLCNVVGKRDKRLEFQLNRRELWNQAQPFLMTPVKKIIREGPVPRKNMMFKANISALAEYTNINEGSEQYYAVDRKAYMKETKNKAVGTNNVLTETQHLELWKYDPEILADMQSSPHTIDPLSLYLTLKGDEDERIIKAINELLGGIQW